MKLHPHLVNAVAEALLSIFVEDYYADKVIERALRNHPKWGARDRHFVAETVYEIVRHFRKICFCLDGHENSDEPFDELYAYELFGTYLVLKGEELPEWEEFNGIDVEKVLANSRKLEDQRAIRESLPDWLDQLGAKSYGPNWDVLLRSLNQQAEVVLRTNTLKTTRKELKDKLEEEGIDTHLSAEVETALILPVRKSVFRTEAYREGLFEVQDQASQCVAPFLHVKPGFRVIDACAGAGGKSLHLAAIMANKGKLICLDVEDHKLEELRKRQRRAGVDNIEVHLIESQKVIKRLTNSADRLLLDVPCSGLGVLRRSPDTKWKLTPEELERLDGVQKMILSQYPSMLKVGGKMVYATCSLLPSENQEQLQKFLESVPGKWEFEEEKTFSPLQGSYDGFYMARLTKLS